ncbi:YggT family protein [Thaumasiovibrio subtropicus]|uniref:YggT family protein n=1 Tax=Thaumasiovibrio subtropicus TaxID=1891207 RepID=UPI000B363F3A|nr:YggT family protein [Thaumasiovibrio subtropicus]
MNAIAFLVTTVFDLYIMVVLLRVWLQWSRADFYNPFSQFVVKATQPVVAPLRRLIPPIGSLDLATVLFAYVLSTAKFLVLQLVLTKGAVAISPEWLLIGLMALVKAAGSLVFWVMILRAILSWVSQGRSPVEYVMHQLSEPVLAPIRRILPSMGGIDLSVMVFLIGLNFLNIAIGEFIGPVWYQL